MSEKQRWPHAQAFALALEIKHALAPFCERIEIAGSLRRNKPDVGDAEILFVPRIEKRQNPAELFESPMFVDMASQKINAMLRDDVIRKRYSVTGKEAWGPKNKLAVHTLTSIPIDFFAVLPERCKCCNVANDSKGTTESECTKQHSVQKELRHVRQVLPKQEPENMQQNVQHKTPMVRGEGEENGATLPDDGMRDMSQEICEQKLLEGKEGMLFQMRESFESKGHAGSNRLEETHELIPHSATQAGLRACILPRKIQGEQEKALRSPASPSHGAAPSAQVASVGDRAPQERDQGRQQDKEFGDRLKQNAHGERNMPSLPEGVQNKIVCPICNGTGWHAPSWWVSLVIRTGGEETNLKLTNGALARGAHLNAYGAGITLQNKQIIPATSERHVFELCNVPYQEPEFRE
jgi:hypothetical protein